MLEVPNSPAQWDGTHQWEMIWICTSLYQRKPGEAEGLLGLLISLWTARQNVVDMGGSGRSHKGWCAIMLPQGAKWYQICKLCCIGGGGGRF